MPGKIRNPHAYAAAVARNKVLAGYAKKAGGYLRKKAVSYLKDPQKLQRDYQRGATFVRAIQGAGDYGMPQHFKHTGFSNDYATMNPKHPFAHGGRSKYKAGAPKVRKLEKGEMCISHSEYIGELISSGTTGTSNFLSQVYGINPGNAGTFPWLSSTAVNFQDYRFKKLIFEYRPLVSESTSTSAATLTSMGSVIMATQYDSVVGAYINKNTMENSDFSASCKPSEHKFHAIECNPRFNPLGTLYVSSNLSPTSSGASGDDLRFQNLGLFQIASCNIPIASNTALDLGEIWVHYEIELYKPQLNAGLYNIQSSHYVCNSGVSGSALLANATASSTNYMILGFPTSNSFQFPLAITEGTFLCIIYVINATAITTTATNFTVANGSAVIIFNSNTGGDDGANILRAPYPAAAVTSNDLCLGILVSVNAPGAALCTVTLPNDYTITGSPQSEIFVTQWNLSVST